MLIMVSGESGVLNRSCGNTGVGCLFAKTQHENTRTLGKKRASNTDEANEINKSVEGTLSLSVETDTRIPTLETISNVFLWALVLL